MQNVQKKKGSESPARRDSKYAVACVTCVLGQIRYADVVAGVEDQTELEIVGQTYRNRQVERFIYVLGIDFDVAFFRFGRQQEAGLNAGFQRHAARQIEIGENGKCSGNPCAV